MLQFLLTRLLSAAVVVLGVTCLVFLLIHLVPGDPVEVMLGENARPADRAELREALGLDRPVPAQLAHYIGGLARLDLGRSLHSKRPIAEVLAERLPATAELALAALAVAVTLALPLGVLAAVRQGRTSDYLAMGFSVLGVSIPNFVMGPLLILLFSLSLGWLPVSGREAPGSLVLPALTLGTALAAVLSRMVRSSLLEVLSEDYIRTARAKGLSERVVIYKHALRNSLIAIITLMGTLLPAMIGGSVIIEYIFNIRGMGLLAFNAILQRDYPVIMAVTTFSALLTLLGILLSDLLYSVADPRITHK